MSLSSELINAHNAVNISGPNSKIQSLLTPKHKSVIINNNLLFS